MAVRSGRRHFVLLFLVLAGLFLMHGLSAGACHDAPSAMSAMPAMHSVSANHQTAVGEPVSISDRTHAGEMCIPLRPEGLSGLFLALFLIGIALWLPGLPHSARLIRPHWPHGPPRTGAEILRTLSISRT